jgi:hypothetical protein
VPDGHHRRGLHERGVRLGLRQAGAQDLLQHHDHQHLGRVALIIGTIELIGVLADQANITSGPIAAIAGIPLDYAGYGIVALFVLAWALALAVWRFGRIEERWSSDLAG